MFVPVSGVEAIVEPEPMEVILFDGEWFSKQLPVCAFIMCFGKSFSP